MMDKFIRPFPGEQYVMLSEIRREIERVEDLIDRLYEKSMDPKITDEAVIKKLGEDVYFNEGKLAGLKFTLGFKDKSDSYNVNDDTLAVTDNKPQKPIHEYIVDASGYISTKDLIVESNGTGHPSYSWTKKEKIPVAVYYEEIKYK